MKRIVYVGMVPICLQPWSLGGGQGHGGCWRGRRRTLAPPVALGSLERTVCGETSSDVVGRDADSTLVRGYLEGQAFPTEAQEKIVSSLVKDTAGRFPTAERVVENLRFFLEDMGFSNHKEGWMNILPRLALCHDVVKKIKNLMPYLGDDLKQIAFAIKKAPFLVDVPLTVLEDHWHLWKRCGLHDSAIQSVLRNRPNCIALSQTDLLARIESLRSSLQVSETEMMRIVAKSRGHFLSLTKNFLLDKLQALENGLGDRELARQVIITQPVILSYDVHATMEKVDRLVTVLALPREQIIGHCIGRCPSYLTYNLASIEQRIKFFADLLGDEAGLKLMQLAPWLISYSTTNILWHVRFWEEEMQRPRSSLGTYPVFLALSKQRLRARLAFLRQHNLLKTHGQWFAPGDELFAKRFARVPVEVWMQFKRDFEATNK